MYQYDTLKDWPVIDRILLGHFLNSIMLHSLMYSVL